MDTPDMPPWQTMFNWIAGAIGVILTTAFGIVGFWFRRYIDKIDAVEKLSQEFLKEAELTVRYASAAQMAVLEKRIEGLVSRRELLSHLAKLAEDRQHNHEENINRLDRTNQEIRNTREDIQGTRSEIRDTHERIDKIYTMLTERSARK